MPTFRPSWLKDITHTPATHPLYLGTITMANRSLQDHRRLIIHLYKQGSPEEEIAEELCECGINTTFSEVLQYLETWHVIPCPSPVHSKDGDNPTEQPRPDRRARLSVTCHHGETSHTSRTTLVSIPCDPTPIESYQQDIQRHEELACGYRPAQVEPATETELPVVDSDNDNIDYEDEDLSAWLKQCQQAKRDVDISSWFKRQNQAKRDQDRVNKSAKRVMRKAHFRRKLGDQK